MLSNNAQCQKTSPTRVFQVAVKSHRRQTRLEWPRDTSG